MSKPTSSSSVDTDTLDISTSRSSNQAVDARRQALAIEIEEHVVENAKGYCGRLIEDVLPSNIAFKDVYANIVKESDNQYQIIHPVGSGSFHIEFKRECVNTQLDTTVLVYTRVVEMMNAINGITCSLSECSVKNVNEETFKINALVFEIQKDLVLADGQEPSSNIGAYILQKAQKWKEQYDEKVANLVRDYTSLLAEDIVPMLTSHASSYPLTVSEDDTHFRVLHPVMSSTKDRKSPFVITIASKNKEDEEPRQAAAIDATQTIYNKIVDHFNAQEGVECKFSEIVQGETTIPAIEIVIRK